MPANTGNIGRTCCATGTRLHLIEPMGFRINDKMLKRAGLDYWEHLDVTIYDSYEDFLEKNPKARDKMYMATTKARHRYTDVSYEEDAYIMFGKESAGIPEEILVQTPDTAIRIPMNPQIRSLNLSNSGRSYCMRRYAKMTFSRCRPKETYIDLAGKIRILYKIMR